MWPEVESRRPMALSLIMKPPSKTAYERFITDNPDLRDPRYIEYVRKGGSCWGHYFREHHAKEFNKLYETMWSKRPDLWSSDVEI